MSEVKKRVRAGRIILYAAIFVALVALDQFTKILAETHLADRDKVDVLLPLFGFRFVENQGAAWGMMAGRRILLIILPIVSIGVLSWFCYNSLAEDKRLLALGTLFIMSGGAGNLIDRAFRPGGAVIDFIELRFMDFPVFNVADLCVTIGVILVVVYLLFSGGKSE